MVARPVRRSGSRWRALNRGRILWTATAVALSYLIAVAALGAIVQ
jgi:hypothetical protein